MEYAWFNNVETKPGIGYPKDWENQERWKRRLDAQGATARSSRKHRRQVARAGEHLRQSRPAGDRRLLRAVHLRLSSICSRRRKCTATPTARPRSLIIGRAHGEDRMGAELGGNPRRRIRQARRRTYNFEGVQKDIYGQFENTFMMYLPRLCEHCLNPACVAACPSGAIYKREEDGIVLIDQDKCRGWRMCVSGCPYKKIYYNWSYAANRRSASSAIRASRPASRRCVRKPASAASAISAWCCTTPTASRRPRASRTSRTSIEAQLDIFLDPARSGGDRAGAAPTASRDAWIEAAQALADLQDGDGVEGRVPAASGIPHAADGLVRAAAVADPVGGATPARSALDGEMPDVRSRCAFRSSISPTC